MATISVMIPADNHTGSETVDLNNHAPVHVMFLKVKNGFEPDGGCIWKMTKASGGSRDNIGMLDHFKSLSYNGIADGDTVILEEVPLR